MFYAVSLKLFWNVAYCPMAVGVDSATLTLHVGLAQQQYIKSYLTMSSLKDTYPKEVISKHCFFQNMHGFNIIKKPRVSRCFRRETKFTRHDRRCCWSYFLFYNYFLKNCRMYWRLLSACWSSGMILA